MTPSAPVLAPTPTMDGEERTPGAYTRTAEPTHLAHAPEWLEIIQHAYGHRPLVLRTTDASGRSSVLPAVIVRRPLLGTVVVSMPFLDGGGPYGAAPETQRVLVDRLIADARAAGARTVDLRLSERLDAPWTPSVHKVNLVLALPAAPDALWARVGKNVRNEVRKAERSGLRVERAEPRTGLGDFYEIHEARMRDLGTPAHSRRFFEAALSAFGDRVQLLLVRKGSEAVGGLIALESGDSVTVPWASCRREYFPLCPNMLLYWEAIRGACARGFGQFDFGRSTQGSGTWRFKRQWGAMERPLFWYTLPVGRPQRPSADSPPEPTAADDRPSRGAGAITFTWRRLPPPVTRWLGPRLRGYLVQ